MNHHFFGKVAMPLGVFLALGGCVTPPTPPVAPARMCSKPIGTAYVEEPSAMDKIAMMGNNGQYPKQEIERMLMDSNCFRIVEGGPNKNDPMLMAQRMLAKDKGVATGPKIDYRISTSVVFAEKGSGVGHSNVGNSMFRADKQNGRATIKLVEEKTDRVIAIVTGEGVYQDTQWNSMGPSTNRSTNRVLELAFKNAIDNLVVRIDPMSR